MNKASTVPLFLWSKKSVDIIYDMKKWPSRLHEARMYLLMDISNYMLKELRDSGAEIDVDGKPKKYVEDLRIGILENGRKKDVVAIYLNNTTETITEDYATRTALYFNSHAGSPRWVGVLSDYGPWPAHMVPVQVTSTQAKIISRRARKDEILRLSENLTKNSVDIESALLKLGARNPTVGNTTHGFGLTAHEDLGYNVLRREFGFDGEKMDSHWRPAFKRTKKYAEKCMEKVVVYMTTGNKNIFDMPNNADKIGKEIVRDGSGFAKEIAPFV